MTPISLQGPGQEEHRPAGNSAGSSGCHLSSPATTGRWWCPQHLVPPPYASDPVRFLLAIWRRFWEGRQGMWGNCLLHWRELSLLCTTDRWSAFLMVNLINETELTLHDGYKRKPESKPKPIHRKQKTHE